MRTRAFRRSQEQKKKQWVREHFHNYWLNGLDDAKVGIRAHTPHICSCYICGNPRKHWKQKTLQELKADDALIGQLEESLASNSRKCRFESD